MEALNEQQQASITQIDQQLKTDIGKLDKTNFADVQKAIKLAMIAKNAKAEIYKQAENN